jgi:DNA-binding MarR family transcriptional regulator
MRDDFTLGDAVSQDAGPGTRSFTEWYFGFRADDPGDRPPDAAPDTPAELPGNRSLAERISVGAAAIEASPPPTPEERTANGSLGEALPGRTADPGGADAGSADDGPELPSPGELFFRRPADPAGPADPDATAAEPRQAHRSLTDSNPWRRSPDQEERAARAELIADLVARWELGTVHRLHALAASHELGLREFLVLSELVARPAGLTASQLTGVVGGGAARMSVLLRGLEQRGLVERDPDPFDSRSVLVGASERARDFLPHRAAPELRRFVRHEFGGGDRADAVAHLLSVAGPMAYGSARDLREGRRLV